MTMPKRKPLTQDQFDELQLLPDWQIDEVPQEHWKKIPGLARPDDTFAVMASGSISNPQTLNGINAIAGLDILVHEGRRKPDELPGNAYHFVIQKIDDPRYPYLIHGEFKSETIVPHWFEADNLDVYWAE